MPGKCLHSGWFSGFQTAIGLISFRPTSKVSQLKIQSFTSLFTGILQIRKFAYEKYLKILNEYFHGIGKSRDICNDCELKWFI